MIFEDITLEWNGVEYHLRGDDQVMRALAVVEDHITFAELIDGSTSGKIPLAKIASAYAAVLRQAGCYRVTNAEVYNGMFAGGVSAEAIQAALSGLMEIMIPPQTLRAAVDDATPKKPSPRRSSSKRTKQR